MSFPYRPGPPPGHQPVAETGSAEAGHPVEFPETGRPAGSFETGHPAVDEVLRSLENAAQLPPAEQIAEFEAAHQVLRETLASIDG